jgi:hypothetical protein
MESSRLTAFFAILAVAWTSLWPLVSSLEAKIAGEDMPLCHQAGMQVDPSEMPRAPSQKDAPPEKGKTHCPLCIMAFYAAFDAPVAEPSSTSSGAPSRSMSIPRRSATASRSTFPKAARLPPDRRAFANLQRENPMRMHRIWLAGVLASAAGHAAASCGAAFCLVNTDWSVQGAWTEPGVRFDLRFESIDLDRPRSGRDSVSVGQIPRHHDEVLTENRNLIGTVDWSFASRWGVSLAIPYVDRHHEHIHNHRGAKLLETWDFRELGDVSVNGRYEFMRDAAGSREPADGRLTSA